MLKLNLPSTSDLETIVLSPFNETVTEISASFFELVTFPDNLAF
jgi:hypothetical protein